MELVLIIIVLVELCVILGAVSKLSQTKTVEYDGNLVLMETEEKRTFSFEVKTDPGTWLEQDHIILKVVRETEADE